MLFTKFLSSNAQDFIEERSTVRWSHRSSLEFLSSNAQDFIEDIRPLAGKGDVEIFLSSNAQDFIEERRCVPAC